MLEPCTAGHCLVDVHGGNLEFNWKAVLVVGAGYSYIGKQVAGCASVTEEEGLFLVQDVVFKIEVSFQDIEMSENL